MIKLIILDVDGVMTNGRKFYDKDGNIICKEFCDKDWTAIKRFKALCIPVVFLSGDSFNRKIAEGRNIPFFHNVGPKEQYLHRICNTFNVFPKDCVYVGDDLFDVTIAKLVGYTFCPADAIDEMKNISVTLGTNGGNNVIMYLYNHFVDMQFIPEYVPDEMKIIYDLDSKEIKHV